MSVSDFLKNLPTHNSENFTKLNSSDGVAANGRPLTSGSQQSMTSRHRPAVYVPTTDYPTEQLIVTERTNILLRYLHQQWDKKTASAQRKREAEAAAAASGLDDSLTSSGPSSRKKMRLDPIPNVSNTQN